MASTPRVIDSADPLLIPQGEYAGKQPLKLQKSVVVVGGHEKCHLHLISSSISRHHALIINDQDGVYVRDLGSRTKVVVNGQPQKETLLADEDEILIGKFSFRFAAGAKGANGKGNSKAPIAAMRVMVNGKAAPEAMSGRTLLIGKGDGCDISLGQESVSSRHAVIFTAKGKRYLRDLDSRTGTILNGKKIHQQEIHAGDELRVGENKIVLAEVAQPAPVVAEAPKAEERPVVPVASRSGPVPQPVKVEDAIPLEVEPVQAESQSEAAAGPALDLPLPLDLELEPAAEEPARKAKPLGFVPEVHEASTTESPQVEAIKAKEPEIEPLDLPEPIGLEFETETTAQKPEIDLSMDSVLAEPKSEKKEGAEPEPLDLPQPISLELGTEALAQVPEIDLSIDSIVVEPKAEAKEEPAPEPLELPEPIASKIETETPANIPEIDLSMDSIVVEPPTVGDEQAAEDQAAAFLDLPAPAIKTPEPVRMPESVRPPETVAPVAEVEDKIDIAEPAPVDLDIDLEPEPEIAAKVETPEPVSEPALPEADLAEAAPEPQPEPAEEPIPVAMESSAETHGPISEPDVAPIDVADSFEAPAELNLTLDLESEPKFARVELPSFDEVPAPPEPSAAEMGSSEPVISDELAPQPATAEEVRNEAPPVEAASEAVAASPDIPGASDAGIAPEEVPATPKKKGGRGRKPAVPAEPKLRKATRAKVKRVPPPRNAKTSADEDAVQASEASPLSPVEAVIDAVLETGGVQAAENVVAAAGPDAAIPEKMDAEPARPEETIAESSPVIEEPERIETSAKAAEPPSEDWDLPAMAPLEEISPPPMPEEPFEVAPTLSVTEQEYPEISQTSDESSVMEEPVVDATAVDAAVIASSTVEFTVPDSPILDSSVSEPALPDSALTDSTVPDSGVSVSNSVDQPETDWSSADSAVEETPAPIAFEDEPIEAPAITVEPEAPEAPEESAVAEKLSSDDWELPPVPSEGIAAPTVTADQAPEPVVHGPQSTTPPAAGPKMVKRDAVFEASLSSIAGLTFISGGTVNLAHSLGGMPIRLPELPPTPAGFGNIRFDWSGKPQAQPAAPRPGPSAERAAPPPPPLPPVTIESAAPEISIEQPPVDSASAESAGVDSMTDDLPEAKIAAEPEVEKPAEEAVKPPPVSFTPRPPRSVPFATDEYQPDISSGAKPAPVVGPAKTSSAFDGLAMGLPSVGDVFSDMGSNATPINDAPFGGAPMGRADDYVIPESDARAAQAAEKPQRDFAADSFWDRTDAEEESVSPASKVSRNKRERPIKPPAMASSAAATDESDVMGTPLSEEELNDLTREEHAEAHVSGIVPPKGGRSENTAPENSRPAKRRRFRIPFLMPIILVGVVAGAAAIWHFLPVQSQINGTMTFVNFNYIPGTKDSTDFEASQRRLLDVDGGPTRQRAVEILHQNSAGVDAGFLESPELFGKVASSVAVNSGSQSVPPQTLLQLSYTSMDKDSDKARMLALLQAMAERNAPQLDANRRLREQEQQVQRVVDEDQQKLETIKNQLADLQSAIEAAPPVDQLNALTRKKDAMERARLDAKEALARDTAEVARLQAPLAAEPATTQPVIADAQLRQMRQQLADLSAEVDSARSDQLAGAVLARQKLEAAAKDFDDQVASANALLGGGSQLRQFVDSAMDSQTKARNLINMLIVDGEDLVQQLEDTRRDVEDLIQTQLAEKWALDPQLQSLRENLDSAQHRYNANTGQGVTDPRILDPLQKEIDNWSTQVKQRQNELGADPAEVKVQESLNNMIGALRKKLAKEKHQTDEVLDPLEKQLADMDPAIAALPTMQQDLAHELHDRLDALNDARQKYADSVGDDSIAPSAKVTELRSRIAQLKTDIAARQADLQREAIAARAEQHNDDLAAAQARVQADQKNVEAATKSMDTGLNAYDELHARQVAAESAQQKKTVLLDEQRSVWKELEAARKDRDEKLSAADHAFDIKPVTSADVVANSPADPRMMYMAGVLGVGLVGIALAAFVGNGGGRRSGKPAGDRKHSFDSLGISIADEDDHAATA